MQSTFSDFHLVSQNIKDFLLGTISFLYVHWVNNRQGARLFRLGSPKLQGVNNPLDSIRFYYTDTQNPMNILDFLIQIFRIQRDSNNTKDDPEDNPRCGVHFLQLADA